MATLDEYTEELLAEMQPLAFYGVVQTILVDPIPEAVKKCLLKPLLPKSDRPSVAHQKSKEKKWKVILEEFDPLPASVEQGTIRSFDDYQKDFFEELPEPARERTFIDLNTQVPPPVRQSAEQWFEIFNVAKDEFELDGAAAVCSTWRVEAENSFNIGDIQIAMASNPELAA